MQLVERVGSGVRQTSRGDSAYLSDLRWKAGTPAIVRRVWTASD